MFDEVDAPASLPVEVEFTKEDLDFLRMRARHYITTINVNATLPGQHYMTESERVALCWLMASSDLISRKRCGSYFHPRLDGV